MKRPRVGHPSRQIDRRWATQEERTQGVGARGVGLGQADENLPASMADADKVGQVGVGVAGVEHERIIGLRAVTDILPAHGVA